MTPDVLERIFVQRGDMAEHLVGIVRESVRTPAKHHTLVLGPRGIGKTHLLSLVHHRIAKQEDLQDRMRIAWLREEEWGVSSFLDLLHRILRTLVETYQDADLHAQTEKLFGMAAKTAERRAGDLLRSFLDGRTLVLMTENLDDVFSGLGKKEQHRFRAYLQEEESWTIVATAQGLFAGVSLHDSPFYGFFEVHHLQELSVDDAARLVINIARLSDDEELATFVQSPKGRARIRAIHHLAGGNHRVYVILSEFLTRETLDELVDPFLKAMDDLTPYYQARMAQLSAQQRKIIDFLCDTRGAVPVKQIAQRCFMTPQTASSQLKDLREKGYVRSTPIGRDSYYELTEPLMRIALEVKKQREGPVRLFLDFLRYWYSRDELVERLAHVHQHSTLERDYLQRVLEEHANLSDDALLADYSRAIMQQIDLENFTEALKTAERLVELRSDTKSWSFLSWCLLRLGRFEESLNATQRALSHEGSDPMPWVVRSMSLASLSRYQEALEAIQRTIQLAPDNNVAQARLYNLSATILRMAGRGEEALQAYNRAVELVPELYDAWSGCGRVLVGLKRYAEAVVAFDKLRESEAMKATDWGYYAQALENLGVLEEALESVDRQLDSDAESIMGWSRRGHILRKMQRYQDALEAFGRARTIAPDDANVWIDLGETYNLLDKLEEALGAFRMAYEKYPDGVWPRFTLASQLLLLNRYEEVLNLVGNPDVSDQAQHMLALVKVWAFCGLDLPNDARILLTSLLQVGSSLVTDRDAIAPLFVVLNQNRSGVSGHRRWVSMLVESYVEQGAASKLAAGLVAGIPDLVPPVVSYKVASEWLDLWTEIAGSYPEFEIPLRLLAAAGAYQQSADERVLMALPAEERAILEEVLKSEAPPQEVHSKSRTAARDKRARRRHKR
jgi:tetratricopeptide (TPR) repeat protein